MNALFRRTVVLLAISALAGCSTLETRDARLTRELQTPGLVAAARLHEQAGKLSDDRLVVCNLRAAELAVREFRNPAKRAEAERIYAAATVAVAQWVVDNPDTASRPHSFGGLTYHLRVQPPGRPGIWDAKSFKSVGDASKVRYVLLRDWHTHAGVGAPLTSEWRKFDNDRFARFRPLRGYITPVTAVVDFSGRANQPRIATLSLLDPTVLTEAKVDGTEYPLAANFSAPIVDRIRNIREFLIALEGAIHPDVLDAHLYLTQPYDPHRIPVIFVHGLLSHPRMWRDVINDLQADPELGGKYQFWTFYYPTGWPISYSAMRFREELAALEKTIGPHRKMVLVGHSMGGLLSRLQVTEPGTKFFSLLSLSDRKRFETLPPDHLIRRIMTFHANPNVDRVVFICTPHRGSKLADLRITRLVSGLVRFPTDMLVKVGSAGLDMARTMTGNTREMSSMRRLSPSNPMFKILDTLPIKVPYHTIVGDRGRGDTPNSSDGVVPYWSSHLEGAQSEVIVPRDHGAFEDPKAIAEVDRILRLELKSQR